MADQRRLGALDLPLDKHALLVVRRDGHVRDGDGARLRIVARREATTKDGRVARLRRPGGGERQLSGARCADVGTSAREHRVTDLKDPAVQIGDPKQGVLSEVPRSASGPDWSKTRLAPTR